MTLDTAAEWTDQAEEWMVKQVKTQAPPATAAECQSDAAWWQVFSFFARAKMADEALDFLAAVDEYKRSGSTDKAEAVYKEFVCSGAPRMINLYQANFDVLKETFESEIVLVSIDVFDAAYEEILTTLDQDTYRLFSDNTRKVKAELEAQDEAATDEEVGADVEVSDPELVELTRDRIDMAVVDKFNELSIKSLDEGQSVNFYQLDDLVIIQGPIATDDQPYLKWLRAQPGRTFAAMITMKSKGGAFGPGSISVKGASDKEAFKAAVARVSKKKVVFED